jgi:hypothetical protein
MPSTRGILFCAALQAASLDAVFAQDQVTVRGRVRDSGSGAPIASAWIELPDVERRLGVDTAGAFLVILDRGVHRLSVHALGYRSLHTEISLAGDTTMTFTLAVEPLALEGIEVQASRQLVRRSRALPWRVRNVTRADLMNSAAATPVDVLTQRNIQLIPCRGGAECVRWRGALVEPVVCIDEQQAFGGLAQLRTYPMQSFYSLEVHDSGRMVRAYTTWFMDRVREGKMAIRPSLRTDVMAC